MTITDAAGTGTGATATALLDNGIISAIAVKQPGSGYITTGGIKKFVDPLPGLCNPAETDPLAAIPPCPASGKYIPIGVAAQVNYNGIVADQYEIGLVQYRANFSSSLPDSLVRGYVQIAGQAPCAAGTFELFNENVNPAVAAASTGYCGVTPPQYLGPVIAATKDKPVRIIFRNLLPANAGGDLILPTDSTLMGSGMGGLTMLDPEDRARSRTRPAIRTAPRPETRGLLSASRRTGRRCTCTAASRRGSATARRTSGSPRPARTPYGRRASACRTCPTWPRPAATARPTAA